MRQNVLTVFPDQPKERSLFFFSFLSFFFFKLYGALLLMIFHNWFNQSPVDGHLRLEMLCIPDVHYTIICNNKGRRQWHPTPVLLPGKCHGRRSLVGCSPWGREESDLTEWLHFHFSLSCIGEGNGNPLQCSCLENPRNRGAWWAAVYGVAQSWTRLKRLSSSIIIKDRSIQWRTVGVAKWNCWVKGYILLKFWDLITRLSAHFRCVWRCWLPLTRKVQHLMSLSWPVSWT